VKLFFILIQFLNSDLLDLDKEKWTESATLVNATANFTYQFTYVSSLKLAPDLSMFLSRVKNRISISKSNFDH